ncbi:MAG TPA: hypothetical protein VLE22_15675, partial [Bryobacteraceae bacterium]|nr:hypothetical protein [Bryobacteraceae bacterium]
MTVSNSAAGSVIAARKIIISVRMIRTKLASELTNSPRQLYSQDFLFRILGTIDSTPSSGISASAICAPTRSGRTTT